MRILLFFLPVLFAFTSAAQQPMEIQVSFPRFLRQGDRTELRAIVTNHTAYEGTGQAELQLTNAQTGESVDGWFQNVFPAQYITVGAGSSEELRFPVEVPFLFYNTLAWKLLVRLPDTTDTTKIYRNEAAGHMPVLTTKDFKKSTALLLPDSTTATLPALLAADGAEDIDHYALTISAATDPALLLYPQLASSANGAGQTIFDAGNRLFAAALLSSKRFAAARPKQDNPSGRTNGLPNDALLSIERTQTPWLRGLTSGNPETEFFALAARQQSSGGFSWTAGGREDIEATVQVIRQLAWLRQLEAIPPGAAQKTSELLTKAARWMNRQITESASTQAFVQALPQLLYTASLLPQNDAFVTSKMQQLLSGVRSENLQPEDKGYLLLALRNNNLPEQEALFAQLLRDSAFLNHKNAPAMLLLYATAQGLAHLKTNLAQKLLRTEGDISWTAYALLRAFSPTVDDIPPGSLRLGNQQIAIPSGAPFFMQTIKPPFIKPTMGALQSSGPEAKVWTMITWDYFQEQPAESNTVGIQKKFFKKGLGTNLQPIEAGSALHAGDTITVQLSVAAPATPEKAVLQDSWPAAMEAISEIPMQSRQYGQIEFFIEPTQAPTVFRYDLVVRHAGAFSSGGTRLLTVPAQKIIASLPPEIVYTE